jgi:hypothetical protein
MAIEKLKSRFNAELDKSINRLYGGYAKGLGSKVVVNFILGGTSAVADFIEGTKKVMDQMQFTWGDDESTFNNTSSWTHAIETTNKKIKQDRKIGQYKLRTYKEGRGIIPSAGGVYLGEPLSSGNLRLDLMLYAKDKAGTEKQVQNIWDSYTKKVWTTWISQQFPGMEEGQTSFRTRGVAGMMRTEDSITRQNSKNKLVQQSVISAFRINTKKEHAMGSTRALFALKDLENSNPPLHDNISMQTTDVIQYIKDNLQVDISQTTAKAKVGKYEFDNIVEIRLGSNPQLKSDRRNIKILAEEFFREEIEEKGKYNNVFGHDKEGSKSPKQQVIEDAIIDLVGPLTKSGKPDMRFKANKKFKKTRKSVNVKKQSDTGSIVTKAVGVSKAMSATRPQKEKRRTQENTQKLKAYINRKLPAQIRRNMGKTGVLTNRSGTFSNSPRLLNIRETQTGLTGDYTYMKTGGGTPPRSGQPGVYQTFENSGRWNGKYNPKDLITKSIRELARQETTQRFVQLRRK